MPCLILETGLSPLHPQRCETRVHWFPKNYSAGDGCPVESQQLVDRLETMQKSSMLKLLTLITYAFSQKLKLGTVTRDSRLGRRPSFSGALPDGRKDEVM